MKVVQMDPDFIRVDITHETGWKLLKLLQAALLDGDVDLLVRDYGELLSGMLELALTTLSASQELVQARYELDQLERAWAVCQERSESSTTTARGKVLLLSPVLQPSGE